MKLKPPLVAVVGPTASGKTAMAIALAEEFRGEIVSADSRQVYQGLDIGTDKATDEEQARVPHHLLDVASPTDTFTLSEYQEAAFAAIDQILDRNKLPILAGGTGLYVQAVIDNLQIPRVPPQPTLREELELLPTAELLERLKACDPIGFEAIDQANRRRLIRAIEVSETAGIPFSELKAAREPRYDICMLGILRETHELHKRIIEKMDRRLNAGLIDEVEVLHARGVPWEQFEVFGLEYRRVAEFLQNKIDETTMHEQMKKELFAFAKRQMTWFKRDSRIRWIKDSNEAQAMVSDWLGDRLEKEGVT